MPLTADDVRRKQFKPSRLVRRGYDEAEVDDFLDEVAAALVERDTQGGAVASSTAQPEGRPANEVDPVAPPAYTAPPPSETATALLALAQRTAEQHVVAAEAAAAEALATAERDANKTLTAAAAEARRLIEEAEQQRDSILATARSEQQRVSEAAAVMQATAERATQHLHAYLSGLLHQVQEFPTARAQPELTAIPA